MVKSSRWPKVFNRGGNIRKTRVPLGRPAVFLDQGRLWILMYKQSYLLCGRSLAREIYWIVVLLLRPLRLRQVRQVVAKGLPISKRMAMLSRLLQLHIVL